jgi:hypothetical protein
MKKNAFFLALFLLFLPAAALANPIIACHCFQERSYNPDKPAAADPYFLATTQNSLLAATFALVKRQVVREKMSGTPGEQLWVAHYLAARGELPASLLLSARDRSGSWQAAVSLLNLENRDLAQPFADLLAADAGDEALSAAVVDEIVSGRLGIPADEVSALRRQGADNARLILAAYLGRRQSRPPLEIYEEVSAGGATWGELLGGGGDTAKRIEEDIRRLLE